MKRIMLALMALVFMTLTTMAAKTAPVYPGGDEAMNKFIKENLKYPESAKANGIEGVVTVGFVVKSDGSIGSIKILRMVDPDLEQESIRLVKMMPKWTPGTNDGVPEDAQATVSIPFSLE